MSDCLGLARVWAWASAQLLQLQHCPVSEMRRSGWSPLPCLPSPFPLPPPPAFVRTLVPRVHRRLENVAYDQATSHTLAPTYLSSTLAPITTAQLQLHAVTAIHSLRYIGPISHSSGG